VNASISFSYNETSVFFNVEQLVVEVEKRRNIARLLSMDVLDGERSSDITGCDGSPRKTPRGLIGNTVRMTQAGPRPWLPPQL